MRRLVRAAWVVMAASLPALLTAASDAVPAAVAPGTFTGSGFDACTAPTSQTMDAWLASPYRAVGIYFGGVNRACTQPELTAGWVAHQQANGWHLLPVFLGLQAPCTTSNKKHLIDPARAAVQGGEAADVAVTAADGLGLPPSSTLYFDMEAYDGNDPACTRTVLTFLGAWTSRLHDRGYVSGVYGSLGSTVRDLVADYASTTRPHPDDLWFARYDGDADVHSDAVPDAYWSPHRRIHQYLGGHDENYGGVTINVDNDYVDVAPLPGARFGDFTGNGWSDLLARDRTTGTLFLYPGNGTNLEPRVAVRSGWSRLDAATRFGDFTGDGREDVIARDAATGDLWLYPGNGAGLGPRVRLGTGWNAMREITAAGDLDGDGHADLLAVRRSSGRLFFYPGHGTRLGAATRLGPGWNTVSELTGVGDLTGDGLRDLVGRATASGTLYLYPGRGVGFASRIALGAGWSGRRALTGVGDFDRDGHPDLMAVDTATGTLYLYPGRTAGLAPRIRLSGGWSSRGPLL